MGLESTLVLLIVGWSASSYCVAIIGGQESEHAKSVLPNVNQVDGIRHEYRADGFELGEESLAHDVSAPFNNWRPKKAGGVNNETKKDLRLGTKCHEGNTQFRRARSAEDVEEGVSLAFVFDTTGSMSDELDAVKRGAEDILSYMASRPDNPIHDYVLVPFNDPTIGPVTHTTNPNLFKQRLSSLTAFSGDTCPEMCLSGLKRAIEISKPRSHIYVFTDASAADYYLWEAISSLIQRKQPKVDFILTGRCMPSREEAERFKVYEMITSLSAGQIFDVQANSIQQVLSFIKNSIQSQENVLLSANVDEGTSQREVPLEVDESLDEFTVSVAGKQPRLDILNPFGHKAQPPQISSILDLPNITVIRTKNPEPGQWTIGIHSESPHTVRATGTTKLSFQIGFCIAQTNNLDETASRPLKDEKNILLVKVSDPNELDGVTEVRLVSLDGTLLLTLPVDRLSNTSGIFQTHPFVPPQHLFNIEIVGRTKQGHPLKRISPSAVSPQPPGSPHVSLPNRQVVTTGGSVTLKCHVESLLPVRVQWLKDRVPLSQPTDYRQSTVSLWHIEDVSLEHEGVYSCEAKNNQGTAEKSINLTVSVPPSIEPSPPLLFVAKGGDVSLPCFIKGHPPPSVTWRKGGQVFGHFPAGSTNHALTLKGISEPDEGKYTCIATNSGGKTTVDIVLRLKVPPKIVGWSKKVTVSEGNLVFLVCKSYGSPTPSVTWLKNHSLLPKRKYEGGPYLRFYAEAGDEGMYNCKATNDAGTAMDEMQLTVTVPPKFLGFPSTAMTVSGSEAFLSCTVIGNPQPEVIWKKNGRGLPKNARVEFTDLFISNISKKDEGNYTCSAINSAGSREATVELLVMVPPTLNISQSSVQVVSGARVNISCNADGYPKPHVSWRKVNENKNDLHHQKAFEGQFLSFKAYLNDTGYYHCKAANSYGAAYGYTHVEVLAQPHFTDVSPPMLNASAGTNVTLSCSTVGKPQPSIAWDFSGHIIPYKANQVLDSNGAYLSILDVSGEDGGVYRCVARNKAGEASRSVNLNVQGAPSVSRDLPQEVSLLVGQDKTLECNSTGNPEPTFQWKLQRGSIFEVVDNVHGSTLQLTNVTINDEGVYICTAINTLGAVNHSTVVHVIDAPKWSENLPYVVEVLHGSPVELACEVSGHPLPQVHWEKDYHPIENPSTVVLSNFNQTLMIPKSELHHVGLYLCAAENEGGLLTHTFELKILEAPYFPNPMPNDVHVLKDENVSISCDAYGTPEPTVEWSVDGNDLSEHYNYFVGDTSLLIVNTSWDENQKQIECIAKNKVGQVSHGFLVHVFEPPTVFLGPTSIIAKVGDEVSLFCQVEGNTPPSNITWSKESRELKKVNNSKSSAYQFITSPNSNGLYVCTAENSAGAAFGAVNLTLGVPPVILPSPSEIIALNGSPVLLNCEADGFPPPTITWLKDGQPLVNSSHVRTFDEKFLEINKFHSDLGTSLECLAENIAGFDRKTFDLIIHTHPSILDQHASDVEIKEGTVFSLPCTADGTPQPQVTWHINDTLILKDGYTDGTFSVVNNALVFLNSTRFLSGDFYCCADNIHSTLCRVYHVNIIEDKKVYAKGILQVEVEESGKLLLTCPSDEFYPTPEIVWLKNGKTLPKGVRADDVHFFTYDEGRVLEIGETFESDSGIYTCIILLPDGEKVVDFHVDILVRPYFLKTFYQKRVIAKEGETVSLDCKAKGNPIPRINWEFVTRQIPITNYTFENFTFPDGDTSVLEISSVGEEHVGKYQCKAISRSGFNTREFNIILGGPPKILGKEGSMIVELKKGDPMVLNCTVEATPKPKYQWVHQPLLGKPLTMKSISPVYKVGRASPSHTGIYNCRAHNPLGNASRIFLVTVLVPPSVVGSTSESLTVDLYTEVELLCEVEGFPGPLVTWSHNERELDVKNDSQVSLGVRRMSSYFQTYVLTVKVVDPSQSGVYSCKAENKMGFANKEYHLNIV